MPVTKGFWRFHDGVWVGILGEDVLPPIDPPPPGEAVPPVFNAFGVFKSGVGAVSVAWPTVHDVDQAGFLVVHHANQPPATPSGWAAAPNTPVGTGAAGVAGSVGLSVFWKRAASTAEPPVALPDLGDHVLARIYTYDGVPSAAELADPFDAAGCTSGVVATAGTAVSIPGGTTAGDQRRILLLSANATDTGTNQYVAFVNGAIAPANTRNQLNTIQGVGGGFILADGVKAAAGAVGASTNTLATASKQVHVGLALAPKTTGGPPAGTFRTMVSSQGLDESLWGSNPTPDVFQVGANGTTVAQASGWLDDATAAGACMIIRVTGGNSFTKNPDGTFSPALWKASFDSWKAEVTAVPGGVTKLRAAVASGVWRALYILDDFVFGVSQGPPVPNAYLHAVTFEEIEEICAYVKASWPWMPLVARGPNSYLRAAAAAPGAGDRIGGVRQYHYLDAGWGQYRPRLDGEAVAYVTRQVGDGVACAVGFVGGINMLDQGAGTTPGWGCQAGGLATKCSMSPTEIRLAGDAMLGNPAVHAFNVYSYTFGITYWSLGEIQGAMQYVYNLSLGRMDGPVNVRNDLQPA